MRKVALTLLLLLCACCGLRAQVRATGATPTLSVPDDSKKAKNDSIELSGKLIDSFTYEPVDSVWVMLYSLPDTVLVDTFYSFREHMMKMWDWEYPVDGFHTKVPSYGKYLLRSEKRGYKPLEYAFEIPHRRYNKKVREWELDEIRIHKSNSYGMDRDLDEITVTATKVKMVMQGDTVVYNADAFQLSEGSMLDELVRQLPGVEIRKGGEIYINGEKVQELLVNGNDFFNGDAKQALENLPAYIVQNIKAYQRESKYAYLDKHHEAQKKKDPWVLDVRLKREYAQGWLGNVEAGGGWDKRYMGRLFGIRYTDHSRITLFVNANNTNDNSRPGYETSWSDYSSPTNEIESVSGGIDFHVDGKKTKTEFNTSLNGSRSIVDSEQVSSSQTFLQGGDVWRRSRGISHSQSGSLSWNGSVEFRKKEVYSHINTGFNFGKGKSRGSNESATFSKDPLDSQRGASLDSIRASLSLDSQYAPLFSQRLRDALTNYSLDLTKANNRNFSPNINAMVFTVAPWNGEQISLNIGENYNYSDNTDFSHYDLRQPLLGMTGGGVTGGAMARGTDGPSASGAFAQDFRNRYTQSPNRSNNFHLNAEHDLFSIKDYVSVGISYGYSNSYSRGERNLYRLDELTDMYGNRPWGAGTHYSLGMLPSMRDSLQLCVDRANTYNSINRNQTHDTHLRLTGGGKWGFYFLEGGLDRRVEHMEDTRGEEYQDLSRRYSLWSIQGSTELKHFHLSASYRQSAPGITQMLDIRDDSNPLNISLGNPDLKNTYHTSFDANYHHESQESQSSWSIGTNFNTGSSIGSATIYNRQTGVYTHQPRNVDGNWGTSVNGHLYVTLDKKKRLNLSTSTSFNYNRSVDFSSDDPAEDFDHMPLSRVHNMGVSEWMSLEYRYENYEVSANAEMDYEHATSDRIGFMTINTTSFSYGISSRLGFKHGYSLDMDLTMHSRRGYEDKTMNDDNLLLNASLSKAFFKNRCFVLRLTGHDILQQLDNVRRSLNAQGRTETWYNTQPSYVLLTASYRLDMKPKKKK